MRGHRLFLGVILVAVGIVALPLTAGAVIPAASTFTTKNLTAIGYSANVVPTDNTVAGQGVFNSDLAFWGKTAVQGTYEGFRLIEHRTRRTRPRSSTGPAAVGAPSSVRPPRLRTRRRRATRVT